MRKVRVVRIAGRVCAAHLRVRLEAQLRHRLPPLLAAHRAAAVVVPVAEHVDHAHAALAQRVAQLLRHRRRAFALINVEAERRALALRCGDRSGLALRLGEEEGATT